MRKRGITLVNVIVVVCIVLILFSIAGIGLGPGWLESRRESACLDRLRSIYKAIVLYSEEEGSFEDLKGLGSISLTAISRPPVLLPYFGRDRSVLYCPSTPECAKKKLASSYHWPFVGVKSEQSADSAPITRKIHELLDKNGGKMQIIICSVHDELYYQPRERELDPSLVRAFTIALTVDGSANAGRSDYPRTNSIARACNAATGG